MVRAPLDIYGQTAQFREACGRVSAVIGFLSAPLGWCRPNSAVEEAGSEKAERLSRGSQGTGSGSSRYGDVSSDEAL